MAQTEDPENEAAQRRERDLDLVRDARNGDPRAVDRLVKRLQYVPRVLRMANGRMGRPLSEEDLADLAQEVAIVIWRKIEAYEGRATLETWFHHVCYLEYMNHMRSVLRRSGRETRGPAEKGVEAIAAEGEAPPREYELLERALAGLDGLEADVVRLKHYEDLSFGEIARVAGIPLGSAKTVYYRGLSRLRRELRGLEEGRE